MHPLLKRQIRDHFPSNGDTVPEECKGLFGLIDEAYRQHDRDRAMLERSLDVSSREYFERNAEVKRELVERKRVEEELKRAKEQAEEASMLKDKFVSLVSHDLRTPFASILGLLRLLKSDTVHPLHEDQKALLQHVLKIGEGLVDMIDRLLDIGKLKTGRIRPQMRFVDAADVALKVIGGLNHAASGKDIKLVSEITKGSRIFTDPDLYSEVIHNLVSNSVKFSERGGQIIISLTENGASIAVKDGGKGIRAEDQSRIFRHEEKTCTPGTEGEMGSGLGLPFSMDIMEALGGSITVDSEPGRGSVFVAKLSKVRPLVMVVEDDQLTRMLLVDYLGQMEVDVIEAENGEDALTILSTTHPHLLITDINMPEMDGFKLLEKLKEDKETQGLPIIVITSDDSIETRERAFQLGADDFCGKPPVKHDLLPRVSRLLD